MFTVCTANRRSATRIATSFTSSLTSSSSSSSPPPSLSSSSSSSCSSAFSTLQRFAAQVKCPASTPHVSRWQHAPSSSLSSAASAASAAAKPASTLVSPSNSAPFSSSSSNSTPADGTTTSSSLPSTSSSSSIKPTGKVLPILGVRLNPHAASCVTGHNLHSSGAPTSANSLHHKFDLVVIGSGPAGQKCAINAAKNNKRVAIVDRRDMFGGVCIHTGTIPSKTFREAILHLTGYRQRGFYGKGFIRREDVSSIDVLERVKKVEQWETQTILDQLHRNRIVCIQGTARFIDPYHIDVQVGADSGRAAANSSMSAAAGASGMSAIDRIAEESSHVIQADHFMIACGTRPARNEELYPFDSPLVFDADQILQRENWNSVRHLIVIGGGVIAMEYASMFNALPGCRVTIVDERPSILDFIDSEVVQTLRHIMGRSGATFRLGEKVVGVETTNDTVRVSLASGKQLVGDALFYAVGRQANTDGLNLEAAGVPVAKRGLIAVNEYFQTSQPHIYAAGDVIGFPALASTAMEQGRLASAHMLGHGRIMKPVFPYGIYTIPEISVIGASEQDLTRDKIPYEIGVAKFEETAKGQMVGGQHIDGFLKLLFCPTSRKLLGCAAIGESAVEIIHIAQSVMSLGGTIEYFRDSVFNYPTMAETYRVAAIDGLRRIGIST